MYPRLKCGGRVMRDVAGSRHCGWNGGLTRMDAESSLFRGWIPRCRRNFMAWCTAATQMATRLRAVELTLTCLQSQQEWLSKQRHSGQARDTERSSDTHAFSPPAKSAARPGGRHEKGATRPGAQRKPPAKASGGRRNLRHG